MHEGWRISTVNVTLYSDLPLILTINVTSVWTRARQLRSRAICTSNYSEEEFGYISPQNENDNICTPQSASFLDLLTSNLNRRCVPAYILNYILIWTRSRSNLHGDSAYLRNLYNMTYTAYCTLATDMRTCTTQVKVHIECNSETHWMQNRSRHETRIKNHHNKKRKE